MTNLLSFSDGKSTRYIWGVKMLIALVLSGCAASISTLAQAMMEGI